MTDMKSWLVDFWIFNDDDLDANYPRTLSTKSSSSQVMLTDQRKYVNK